MTETVTDERLLECIYEIQRDLSEMRAELARAASDRRAFHKEMALFLQSRLGNEQPDLRK
ncbi:hypothetical protein [Paracoccus rhizosphaerae]|uniref:Uncharacterized protein n=1 Tax=Paracoccus rhizosphaerae TaxID=1133347 RepID=A0ABV6CIY6_9RHOB|nr:hypothetical protein [Paracoccus rhizosphaerae]